MTRLFPLVALVLFGGCYSYSRVAGSPAVGSDIEVELTDAGAADLARLVGPNVVSIRGRVNEIEPDTMHLAVASVMKRSGVDEYWSKESVAVARANIASVATRKFSAGRSAMLALTAIGGAFIVRAAIEAAVNGDTDTPRPPGQ